MNFKLLCFLFCFLASSFSYAQAPLTPQLKALLDYYFRGPGSSNSVDRIQIKDNAINLSKMDISDVASLFALRSYVLSQINSLSNVYLSSFTEVDPVWNSQKSSYYTIPQANSIFYPSSNPNNYVPSSDMILFVQTNDPASFFTGVVTNLGVGGSTNIMTFENGLLRSNQVLP